MTAGRVPPLLLVLIAAACGAPVPSENETVKEATTQAAATAASPAEAADVRAAIPAAFHGTFDRNRESCASASEYRLTVTADALRFHESLAAVRRVTIESEDTILVAADFEGEGERWSASHQLRLGNGGASLTVTGNGQETVRVRCGAPAAAPATAGWESAASGEGDALYLQAGGGRRLTLFCPSGSAELLVNVPGFRPVGSEERMSFGSGGTVVALVADTRGDSGRGGVSGRGPVPTELETILAGSGGIAVNYGAQNSGPHPAPPAVLARTFAAGCRD